MFVMNPGDKKLVSSYRKAGEMYILDKHGSPFYLPGDTLEEIDAIIQYYSDMSDYAGLISTYREQLNLLNQQPDSDERDFAIAQANANIAWNYLLAGAASDEPRIFAERAMSVNNDLGRICDAIFKLRLGKDEQVISENGDFSDQSVPKLNESYVVKAMRPYNGRGEQKPL